jgi:hypothetical protein
MTAPSNLGFLSIAAPRFPDYQAPPYFMAAGVGDGSIWVYRSDDGSAWDGEMAVPAAETGMMNDPPAICVWDGQLYIAYCTDSGVLSAWTRTPDGWNRILGPAGGLGAPALASFPPPGGGPDCLWLLIAVPGSSSPATALAMTFDRSTWTDPFPLLDGSGNPLAGLGQIAVAPLRALGSEPSRLLMGWGNSQAAIYVSGDGLHWTPVQGPNPPLSGFPAVVEVTSPFGDFTVSVIGADDADPFITTFWGSGTPTVTSWTSSSLVPAALAPPAGGGIVVFGVDGRGKLMTAPILPPTPPARRPGGGSSPSRRSRRGART